MLVTLKNFNNRPGSPWATKCTCTGQKMASLLLLPLFSDTLRNWQCSRVLAVEMGYDHVLRFFLGLAQGCQLELS